jgi:hypothetical protein
MVSCFSQVVEKRLASVGRWIYPVIIKGSYTNCNITARKVCRLTRLFFVAFCIAAASQASATHTDLYAKPKALLLVAQFDPDEYFSLEKMDLTINVLKKGYELDQRKVSSALELCQQVKIAAKISSLDLIWIAGHGDERGLLLDENGGEFSKESLVPRDCLSGLKQSGAIVLESCSTGKGSDSFAKDLANFAQRAVVAPVEDIVHTQLSYLKNSLTFSFIGREERRNITKVFLPQ